LAQCSFFVSSSPLGIIFALLLLLLLLAPACFACFLRATSTGVDCDGGGGAEAGDIAKRWSVQSIAAMSQSSKTSPSVIRVSKLLALFFMVRSTIFYIIGGARKIGDFFPRKKSQRCGEGEPRQT
jgi:hypothetical protein